MDLRRSNRVFLFFCLACLCHNVLSSEDIVETPSGGVYEEPTIQSQPHTDDQLLVNDAPNSNANADDDSRLVSDDEAPVAEQELAAGNTLVGESNDVVSGVVAAVVAADSLTNTTTTELNSSDESNKNGSKSSRPTKVKCLPSNATEDVELVVQILNGSALPNSFQTTPNLTVASCVLTLFYVPWCHFSTAAARNYNALPRLYPDISCFAVNSATYSSLNARYGTVAVPTLLLFHNGQPVAKFNDTQYSLEKFVEFVRKNTGLEPSAEVKLISSDLKGPLPGNPIEETDYLLWLAWIFLISCCCYGVTKSSVWNCMLETLRNNWQEAEAAQHEHAD